MSLCSEHVLQHVVCRHFVNNDQQFRIGNVPVFQKITEHAKKICVVLLAQHHPWMEFEPHLRHPRHMRNRLDYVNQKEPKADNGTQGQHR